MSKTEGWRGWDQYAAFYDWENARTLGRRDVPFWRRVALEVRGRVLELGCGTGRVTMPLAKAGVRIVGVDRSEGMIRRLQGRKFHRIARADIRSLPFANRSFGAAIAPYGILQSLLDDRDLDATLESVARVLAPGAIFGIDLVPDVPQWREYDNRIQLRGRAAGGRQLTLVESVRQDPRRRRTTFAQRYLERKGKTVVEHKFELTFRTLPVREMATRLERAGFTIERVLGDYRGKAWDERADVWIIMAKKGGG